VPRGAEFQYWPRYISRLLRMQVKYCGELLGYKLAVPQPQSMYFGLPDSKPHQQKDLVNRRLFGATDKGYPNWSFSEQYPWDQANTIAEYVYPDVTWTVQYPDGRRRAQRISGLTWQDQTIYPGDIVVVTDPKHPDCVNASAVASGEMRSGRVIYIQRMQRAAIVSGLNIDYVQQGNSPNQLGTVANLISLDSLSLLDPKTQQPTKAEWRQNEAGELVRVALATGRIIPLPLEWETLDDQTRPSQYLLNEQHDTPEADLLNATYRPSSRTFEEEIDAEMNLPEPGPRRETFWY
ncbi:hypothetical protein BOX15_Mlig007089g1, partial [Macrostomum lignano]